MMSAVGQLSLKINDIKASCDALGVPRANYYRHINTNKNRSKKSSSIALSEFERSTVLNILNSDRFVDCSPLETYAMLLDEEQYYCSPRTMYRILAENNQVKERRQQVRQGNYVKPELLATKPNQVWSWDITKLMGPQKWTYFYLYVIMDIYSRYVVGWMVAGKEYSILAEELIAKTGQNENIKKDELTLHADRGSSMKSKPVAFLLSDLGVTKTHNRPYTSNDNPYSESHFKTLKYCPSFPERFGSIQDARKFCRSFFKWYNDEHRHSGINMLTPSMLHHGVAEQIIAHREIVLEKAFLKNPLRFKNKKPTAGKVPEAAWINKPEEQKANEKNVG